VQLLRHVEDVLSRFGRNQLLEGGSDGDVVVFRWSTWKKVVFHYVKLDCDGWEKERVVRLNIQVKIT